MRINTYLSRITSVFGVLSGIGGLVHGIGEVLQGNVAPDGLIINSWTSGPIAEHMGGEPGMTIIPNLFVTGVLTILVSTALIIWSSRYVNRKHSGKVMLALTIMMLLFGGGFGPPSMGLMAGITGTSTRSQLRLWKKTFSLVFWEKLSNLWGLAYGLSVANGVFLIVGSATFPYLGIHTPDLFVQSFFFSLICTPVAIYVGIGKSIQNEVYLDPPKIEEVILQ